MDDVNSTYYTRGQVVEGSGDGGVCWIRGGEGGGEMLLPPLSHRCTHSTAAAELLLSLHSLILP